ncbi:hypothetical protein F7725_022312 [Dissostichus mawsoni]|uniref:Uncharacterized protein n=1 Tax=Dissostichus mawsoni TaxID=36200 RepID=A0A7J5Z0F8_DISMA|nr:hypothetical protein F7725_022312 [Dissostichus mawsoni]
MHLSILCGTAKPAVKRCTTCCKRFHCPLCPKFKPCAPSRLEKHLEVHLKNGIIYGNLQVPFNLQRLGSRPLPSMCKNYFKKRRYGDTPGGLPQVAIHKLPSTSASEHCPGPSSSSPQPNTSALLSLLLPTTTKPFTVNKSWTVERDDWFGNRVCPLHHTRCMISLLLTCQLCEKWWCVMLMENFDLGSHGKMFAHWTETSKALLRGEGPPMFRVRKRKLDEITEKEEQLQRHPADVSVGKDVEKTMEAVGLFTSSMHHIQGGRPFHGLPTSKIVQDCKKAAEWVVAHKHLCTRVHLPDAVSMGEAQLREAVKLWEEKPDECDEDEMEASWSHSSLGLNIWKTCGPS